MVYRGYDREDGLWDIEAELTDIKPYTFELPAEGPYPAHEPIHQLNIRLTVDDRMVIQDLATSLDAIPHAECEQSPANMSALIGFTLGAGWRKVIEQHLGRTRGCTHLREMLFNMATAAFQTIPSGVWQRREASGLPQPELTQPPPYLGQCMTWAFDSPTVQRIYPMLYAGPAPSRASAAPEPPAATPGQADSPAAQR